MLITISQRPFPRLDRFVSEQVQFTTTQRTKLMLLVLDQIVDQYEVYLNKIGRQIKSIRARLRVEEIRNQDFINFVQIEDELNEFMSALTPTNAILRRLLLGKHIPLFADDEDIVEDLLLNNEQSIEACRSSIKSIVNIREAYSTIMANNLNQVIRVLTIATVVISIPTLVASVFGMNVSLPFEGSIYAFSGIMGLALVVSLLLLVIFKHKRWL
jgi:magnesium transporter